MCFLFACLTSCAGGNLSATTKENSAPKALGPIALRLRRSDGVLIDLSRERERPSLLVVIATFDGVSQAAMRPLARFARHNPQVRVIAVLAQPNAETFAPLFKEALNLPFEVAWDPENQIIRGASLGPIEAVPSYFYLSPKGVVEQSHTGYLDEIGLERFGKAVAPSAEGMTE
ncbi:MAG: hypothetical protein RMJ84_02595 [Sandaracinaceae bacterium]|nr:hypothetical protein [Sandaracinaceae bacterium]